MPQFFTVYSTPPIRLAGNFPVDFGPATYSFPDQALLLRLPHQLLHRVVLSQSTQLHVDRLLGARKLFAGTDCRPLHSHNRRHVDICTRLSRAAQPSFLLTDCWVPGGLVLTRTGTPYTGTQVSVLPQAALPSLSGGQVHLQDTARVSLHCTAATALPTVHPCVGQKLSRASRYM